MAGIKYKTRYTSLNGQKFRLELWDTDFTGTFEDDMAIGEQSPTITYDASGDRKFNDICASTMEWTYIIKNDDDELFIEDIIKFGEEQDIYIHLYQENANGIDEYMWGGFLLMDLSTTPDISFPYDVSLRAVDGLGLLKEKKWLIQGATGTTEADTYIPTNKQTFIYWFSQILQKAGAAEVSNGASKDYNFATVNRWYNEEMGATTYQQDPTIFTQCHTRGFYALKENGDYEPDNAYNVLQGMLKSWGMRLTYWMGTYYFVQVNEYITQDTGTSANPINMITHYYQKNATFINTQNHIGDSNFAMYQQHINTGVSFGDVGLQKLEGTEYSYLPAIKNSIVEFESIEDINYFQGYPDMFTAAQFSSEAGSGDAVINTKPLAIWTDAHTGSGWYFYLVMNLQANVNVQQFGCFHYLWTVRAREVGTTPWTNMLNYNDSTNTLSWASYSAYWGTWTNVTINDIINGTGTMNGGGVSNYVNILPNSSNYNQDTLVFDSGSTVNGKIPPPSWSAIGDWEFELATIEVCRGAAQQQNGLNPTRRGFGNQGCGWSNQSNPPTIGLPNAFAKSVASNTEGMSIEYADSLGAPLPNGAINYNSIFSAIMTASNNVGYTVTNTFVSTTTSDTKTNVITGVKYGDTTSPNAPGTLWIINTVSGAISATQPTGLWGRTLQGGTDTFSEVLAKQAINNQYHANPQLNGTIVLSKTDKLNGWRLKSLNPIGRVVDRDANPYVMMRMEFITGKDEWSGEWWQVINSLVNTTTTTGTGGPGNGNGWGNGGGPVDNGNGGGYQGLVQPPIAVSGTQSKIGNFDGTSFQNLGNDKFILSKTTSDILAKVGLTTIPIQNMLQAAGDDYSFLQAGMKLRIVDSNHQNRSALYVYDVEVAVNQSLGDTSIEIVPITTTSTIYANSQIEIDIHQWLISTNNKQNQITLTTTGTSGASTFNQSTGALNIPSYSGGGSVNSNYITKMCESVALTSATTGEALAVVIPYDTTITQSTVNDMTFYTTGGVSGSDYSWKFGSSGFYEISWNVTSDTSVVNNRILSGVKLQRGIEDRGAISWSDVNATHGYIYDRGTGSVRKGTVSQGLIISETVSAEIVVYYRIVFWKEAASNGSMKSTTVINGTNLTIKELQ